MKNKPINPSVIINGRVLRYASIDALIIICAYTITFSARTINASLTRFNLEFVSFNVLLLLLALLGAGVYRRIWSQTSGHGIVAIIVPVILVTGIVVLIDLFTYPRPLPVSVVFFANLIALCGFITIRYRSRLISGLSWRWQVVWHHQLPRPETRLLVIGAGESGQDLAWRLKHRFPNHDYRVMGFIDDDPGKQNLLVEGCPVLGTRNDLVRVVEDHKIDLIVVALHNVSGLEMRQILTLCEHTKARIKVVPDVFKLVHAANSTGLLRDVQPEDLIGRTTITRYKGVDLAPVIGRRILITGVAGSIGSELSRQILDYEPEQVVLLDNNESGLHDMMVELAMLHPHIEIVPALVDISMQPHLRAIFERYKPQIVFHAAAYKHVHLMEYYPHEALRVNAGGTFNLARLAQDYGVERFVLISTDKAVNPSGIMGASKRVCELLLHALCQQEKCDTVFTAVRFGNVLGSRGSIVPTFSKQIDSGGPVTVTHPEMTRYFMSIPEAVNLIIHAACLTKGDDIFILKMGEVVRIVELAERMIRLRGLRPHKDIEITFTGIRPGEKMHEELYTGAEKPVETIHPNIIQLNTWDDDFDPALFFAHVEQLLDAHTLPNDAVLPQLLQVIHPEPTYNNGYRNGHH